MLFIQKNKQILVCAFRHEHVPEVVICERTIHPKCQWANELMDIKRERDY
jgi:hypothetical protein